MTFNTAAAVLDWLGVIVFAISGALVGSRKQMDIVGFALMGTVTGVGGGTIRDILLGTSPVFWVKEPVYLESLKKFDQELAYLNTADYERHAVEQIEEAKKLVADLGLKTN